MVNTKFNKHGIIVLSNEQLRDVAKTPGNSSSKLKFDEVLRSGFLLKQCHTTLICLICRLEVSIDSLIKESSYLDYHRRLRPDCEYVKTYTDISLYDSTKVYIEAECRKDDKEIFKVFIQSASETHCEDLIKAVICSVRSENTRITNEILWDKLKELSIQEPHSKDANCVTKNFTQIRDKQGQVDNACNGIGLSELYGNQSSVTASHFEANLKTRDHDIDSDSIGLPVVHSTGNNDEDIYLPCVTGESTPIVRHKSFRDPSVKQNKTRSNTFCEHSKSVRDCEPQCRTFNQGAFDTVDSPHSAKDPEINPNRRLKQQGLLSDDPSSSLFLLNGVVCDVRPRVKQSCILGSDGSVSPKTTVKAKTNVSKSTTNPNGSAFEGSRPACPVSLNIPQHKQRKHLGFTPASRPASYQQLCKPLGLQSNQHVKQYQIESPNLDLQPKVQGSLNDDQTEKLVDEQTAKTAAVNSRSYLAESGYESMPENRFLSYRSDLLVQPNTAHAPTLTQQGHLKQGLNGGVASATRENTAATHLNTSNKGQRRVNTDKVSVPLFATTYPNQQRVVTDNAQVQQQRLSLDRTPTAGETENQTLPLNAHATTSHISTTPTNTVVSGLLNPATGNLNDVVSSTSKQQYEKTISSTNNDKTTRVSSTSKQLEGANRSTENDKIINLSSTKLTPGKKHHTDDPLWPEYERLFRNQRCNTCWVSHAEILNLPCRHLNACDVCSNPQEFCTSCSQEIIGVVKVYFG